MYIQKEIIRKFCAFDLLIDMPNEKISVCIPARNEQATIQQTLDSVVNNGWNGGLSVFVCVNGSSDYTFDLANAYSLREPSKRNYADIEVFESTPGKANAWNELVKRADSDVVVFCDGDVKVKEGSLNAIYDKLRSSHFAAVGGFSYKLFSNLNLFDAILSYPRHDLPNRTLAGRLYGFDRERLSDRLKHYGFIAQNLRIPSNVINEDRFVSLVCEDRNSAGELIRKHWCKIPAAIAYYHPPRISEEELYQARIHHGDVQLERDFPMLNFKSERYKTFIERFANYYQGWTLLPSFSCKFLGPVSVAMRKIFLREMYRRAKLDALTSYASNNYASGWNPVLSTKRSL